ncbi:MAG: cell division protein FtsQ/DivIB [Neisseriaceae bacterium]|nr:cell division protein FtsQ/DivIB [Neisseriaceae bacterium]
MRLWDNAGALRRVILWLYTLIILCLIGALVMTVVNSAWFPVKHIEINGNLNRMTKAQLDAMVKQSVTGNIFKVDLNHIKETFERSTWIESADVRRVWPDTIVIDWVERKPVAKWQDMGLLDTKGRRFKANVTEALPVFMGPAGSEQSMIAQYAALSDVFEPLQLKIKTLHLTERAAWSVTLENDLTLKLGRYDAVARAQRFVRGWPKLMETMADQNIHYVDLRYRNGFALNATKKPAEPSAP